MIRRLGVGLGLLSLLACSGTGEKLADSSANAAQDVRGLYTVSYSGVYTLRLDVGGAVQERQVSGESEIVTFNAPDGSPMELDLAAFCADPGVVCPSEVLPAQVAIDQDQPEVVQEMHSLHLWDPANPAEVRDGLVRHDTSEFLFALEGEGDSSGSCGALALSLAGGRFNFDPDSGDGGVSGITDGKLAVGWLGICAWQGLAVAATLSIETSWTGTWTAALP